MKAIFAGLALMVVVSVGAYFTLQEMGFSAEEQFSSDSVRLD